MLTDGDVKDLVKEFEKEIENRSPDKYGYVEADVYKKVIKRLKEKNFGGYLDVEKYYEG